MKLYKIKYLFPMIQLGINILKYNMELKVIYKDA